MAKEIHQLGKYELLEKIGEGGYGIVYRGRDPLLEREVAIKVLRSDLASSAEFIERFRREARLAASLRHPNIVTVIEVGEQSGSYYLVMDYLSGGSLQMLLDRLLIMGQRFAKVLLQRVQMATCHFDNL